MTQNKTNAPQSATRGWIVFIGFLTLLSSFYLTTKYFQMTDMMHAAVICIGATALSQIILDLFVLKVHLRPSTGLVWNQYKPSWSRTMLKFWGLVGSMGFIGLLYWLFPEYNGDFYGHYWNFLEMVLPWWLVLAIPYFYFIDAKQIDPNDGYENLGNVVLLHFEKVDSKKIGQHLLGWVVKGYFFPLMFTYFIRDLTKFSSFDFSSIQDFKSFFDFTYDSIFLVDVGIVSMGYMMSLKLTDSHLRSTEPTMKGWVVALVCYQPFWSLIGRQYIDYVGKFGWGTWLADSPTMYTIWGSLILIFYGIYVWSSIMFGIRFSNLTHRGILTNGPYRWTKHPAYVSKNIAWWLISVPFVVNVSFADTLRRCALLALINYIYYLRAKTEEAHLGVDPDYQAYARWIDGNGLFKSFRFKSFN